MPKLLSSLWVHDQKVEGLDFIFYATQWLEAERVYLDIQLIDPRNTSREYATGSNFLTSLLDPYNALKRAGDRLIHKLKPSESLLKILKVSDIIQKTVQ